MKNRREILQTALEDGYLLRLRRASAPEEKLDAFVVGLGDEFVLLHVTDGNDLMCLNGYIALPLREIKKARRYDDFGNFTARVLALKGIAPKPQPDILLTDFPGLLSSVNSHFSLLTIYRERRKPDTCYIGRVAKMKKRSVILRLIDPGAVWRTETRKYRFKDITRVDFDGGYEAALWAVSEADRKALPS